MEFKIGDVVRVRTARRRDVHFTVTELTDTHVRATNDRGGEVFYEPTALEHVTPAIAVTDESWPEPFSGVMVKALAFEPIDSTIKRFKKAVDKSGILKDLRDKERFIAPSDRRRRKGERARRRRGDTSN